MNASNTQSPWNPPPVPAAVRDEEADIISTEGWHHVDGVYYANLSDAAVQRRRLAEQRVRDRERFDQWVARHVEELAA